VPLSAVAVAEQTQAVSQAVYFYFYIGAQAHGQGNHGGVNPRTQYAKGVETFGPGPLGKTGVVLALVHIVTPSSYRLSKLRIDFFSAIALKDLS